MSYDIDPLTDGCYPRTSALISKLDIRNEKDLVMAEAFATLDGLWKGEE